MCMFLCVMKLFIAFVISFFNIFVFDIPEHLDIYSLSYIAAQIGKNIHTKSGA